MKEKGTNAGLQSQGVPNLQFNVLRLFFAASAKL